MVRKGNVIYKIKVERKVSVIRDSSGTGKTLLCDNIEESEDIGSKVKKICDENYNVVTLTSQMFKTIEIKNMKPTVFFVDEFTHIPSTHEFAKMVMDSKHYFVIMTRKTTSFCQIPYSCHCVYELKKIGNELTNVPSYPNKMYLPCVPFLPIYYITEDGKSSGYLLEKLIQNGKRVGVNSSVIDAIREALSNGNVLTMVDGAAFGAYIENIVKTLEVIKNDKVGLFLPESYEWLLLHLSMFKRDNEVQLALSDPYKLADSYERYYEDICIKAFAKYNISYAKGNNNGKVLTAENIRELANMFEGVIFPNREV